MLELEVDTGKGEMARISTVAARAQKELDIARAETKSLTNVVSGLQERLDALEARGSVGSDHPPLESGSSDDGWGPGPGPGRPHAPGRAPRSRPSASAPSLTAPSHHSAGRRNERVPPGSGSEEWRDEWLSADYHNRRAPPRTPVRPRRPVPAPVPIPRAGGRYGGLRDEVPRGDVEWDVGEGEDLDLDLEEFDISSLRGVRREAAELSRRRSDEDAYMERVRREHFGSAYVEEPRRSHRDSMEEMDVAAVRVRGRGQWEPRSTSWPAFMVSKAADAAVWEDLKDIKPPMYDGNPLNLDRFLEKLDDWGLTVTEDLPPADAERYVFKRFRYRLPEVLGELYFVATKEGRIKTLKEAKKWLNEQEGEVHPLPPQRGGLEGGCRAGSPALHAAGSMDQEGHQGGIQEGQVQPHGQDDAPQGVSYKRGGLGEEERGPGCQTALPAERSSHHRLGRSREDRDVAP